MEVQEMRKNAAKKKRSPEGSSCCTVLQDEGAKQGFTDHRGGAPANPGTHNFGDPKTHSCPTPTGGGGGGGAMGLAPNQA